MPLASAGSIFGLSLASQLAGILRRRAGDRGGEDVGRDCSGAALDQNTAILFGDGAGAALVSSRPGRFEVLDSVLHTDGAYRDDLSLEWGAPLHMNGLTVILQAARKLPAVIEEVLKRQNIAAKEVTQFVMHQANQNLITRVAKGLGVEASLMFSNVAKYGNTSSASMFIAAPEWELSGPSHGLSPGGPVVFAGFGAGLQLGCPGCAKSLILLAPLRRRPFIAEATLEKILLMLSDTPGMIAPAATATKPAIKSVLDQILAPSISPNSRF